MLHPLSLDVQIVEDPAELATLTASWWRLVEASGWDRVSLFQTPSWLLPWWQAYGGYSKLVCLACYEGNNLIGLAPLMLSRQYAIRALRFIGYRHSDYTDFLSWPGREADVSAAIFHELERHSRLWDVFLWDRSFRGLASATGMVLPTATDGLRLASLPAAAVPMLQLPRSWASFVSTFSRRRRRRFSHVSDTDLDVSTLPGDVETAIGLIRQLKLNSWRERGREDKLDPELKEDPYWSFLTGACQQLAATGALRLATLRYDGEIGALGIYLASGTRLMKYIQAWGGLRQNSPGMALDLGMIRYAIEQGFTTFDLGMGNEAYKARYGARVTWLECSVIAPRTVQGYASLALVSARRWTSHILGQKCSTLRTAIGSRARTS